MKLHNLWFFFILFIFIFFSILCTSHNVHCCWTMFIPWIPKLKKKKKKKKQVLLRLLSLTCLSKVDALLSFKTLLLSRSRERYSPLRWTRSWKIPWHFYHSLLSSGHQPLQTKKYVAIFSAFILVKSFSVIIIWFYSFYYTKTLMIAPE